MEIQRKHCHRRHIIHSIVFAFLLILAGVAFLGFNLGFIPMTYKSVIFSWPMLLIAWGIISLCTSHYWSGAFWLITGGFFIIPNLMNACPGILPLDSANFVHLYWPLLLIAAGIFFLIQRLLPSSYRHHHHRHCFEKDFEDIRHKKTGEDFMNRRKRWQEEKGGYFNRQSVFSSGEHIVLDPEFKGGEISTVLGDTTLDLRKTNLPEGDTFLNIKTVLGSVTVFVPINWTVEIKIEAILYTFEDKRFEKGQTDITKRLVIIGSGILGGGELRN